MDSKKFRKSFGRLFGWIGLSSCSLIVKFIPQRYLYGFAGNLSLLGYLFAKKQKKIALESLAIAFGNEKSQQEIEQIAKQCFTFMAKSGVEMVYLSDRPELIKKQIVFQGKENLDKALGLGKGVILVSAHFGNFPLMMARMALAGYKIAGIMRPMRDERVEKIFLAKRNKFGIKTIYSQPRDACVKSTIDSLRNNELVFIPLDQNFGTAGVFVNFFGEKAATATGPVVLAQRTKATLVPCFIVRENDDTHKIIFEPALALEEKLSAQETLTANVQKITDIIEFYIRKYPAEWGWIHRRWKSRPN